MEIECNDTPVCPSCESPVEDSDSMRYATISEREICRSCFEYDHARSSTLIRFLDDTTEVIRFGDENAWHDDYDELPDWFANIFEKREYHHTDGWRGYYDSKFKGLVKLADGWLTGFPDAAKRETEAIDLSEALRLGQIEPPKAIFWLFEPTSNIFSMASTIFVAAADRDEIEEWLKSAGFGIEELDRAFAQANAHHNRNNG